MYRCNECGEVFDEFAKVYDKVGNVGDSLPPAYLEYDVCPTCKSDDWESVEWCKNCENEYTTDDYCDTCLANASYNLSECIQNIIAETKGDYDEVVNILKDFIEEKYNG